MSYEKFSLKVQGGKINLCEIILLIGENGTGKTSFIKKMSQNTDIITSVKSQNPYKNLELAMWRVLSICLVLLFVCLILANSKIISLLKKVT